MPRKKNKSSPRRVNRKAVKASRGFASPIGNFIRSAASTARKHKIVSTGLGALASNTSGPFSLAAGLASKIAGSLGFSTPEGPGGTVQGAPAPVAFPRIMDYRPSVSSYTTGGHTIVHAMELVASNLSTLPGIEGPSGLEYFPFYQAGSPEYYSGGTTPLSMGPVQVDLRPSQIFTEGNFSFPGNLVDGEFEAFGGWPQVLNSDYVLPLSGPICAQYLQYKLKGLRLHYEHFCPTSVTGAVYLYFTPNPYIGTQPEFINEWNQTGNRAMQPDIGSMTESQVANSEYVVQGAVYEDCFLDIDLSKFLDPNKWYFNVPNAGFFASSVGTQTPPAGFATSMGDWLNNIVGTFGVFFSNILPPASGVPGTSGSSLGKLWVESVWELSSLQNDAQSLTGPFVELVESTPFHLQKLDYLSGRRKELPDRELLLPSIDRYLGKLQGSKRKRGRPAPPPIAIPVVVEGSPDSVSDTVSIPPVNSGRAGPPVSMTGTNPARGWFGPARSQ